MRNLVDFAARVALVLTAAIAGFIVLLCLAFALALSQPAQAREGGPFNVTPSGWDRETQVSEAIYQAAHLIDCAQTHYIARHPESYEEKSSAWLLGKHPSRSGVVVWCVAVAYGHAAITQALVDSGASKGLQRFWQATTIGLTVNTVSNNYSIGIKWGF
jgi:hypothetical protein